ncbi:MAG: class I SAM-dependent methyltransferase [Pseudomonadota bacterium]
MVKACFLERMQRIPEPELMTEKEQAIAYANADFEEPHKHFLELLKESIGTQLFESGKAADLGCGAADISIRFIKSFPNYTIDAFDGAAAMLDEAKKALKRSGLNNVVNLIEKYIDVSTLSEQKYDLIFSNSLLHHLHDPLLLWNCIKSAKGDPSVFIMDLMRPENDEQVEQFVKNYSIGEPEILQRDFRASLKAAFTPDEVKSQLDEAGLDGFTIKVVSDRHFTIYRS